MYDAVEAWGQLDSYCFLDICFVLDYLLFSLLDNILPRLRGSIVEN